MSSMEYNEGTLTLSTFEYAKEIYPDADIDELEWTTDGNFAVINNKVYSVDVNSDRSYEPPEVIDFQVDSDTIKFKTYHYNGGAHWTEIIEGELNKRNK